MTFPAHNWRPTPELLAAYLDGECEGRDDLAQLKQRIEDWLLAHPQAQEEVAAHRQLFHLWHQTTPPEPSADQWDAMLSRLEPVMAVSARPLRSGSWRWPLVWSASLTAVAAGLALFLVANAPRPNAESSAPVVHAGTHEAPQPAPQRSADEVEDEILPVAQASEVTIIRVEGDDTPTLVVGELPLVGHLELVAPGDVILTSSWPTTGDNVPVRFIESSSPMIWARLESETDD